MGAQVLVRCKLMDGGADRTFDTVTIWIFAYKWVCTDL